MALLRRGVGFPTPFVRFGAGNCEGRDVGEEVMMAIEQRATEMVQPILDDLGLYLYDLTYAGKRLVVTIDTPSGKESPDAGLLTLATRQISRELDEHDPIATGYVLEVTTPGIERKLRRPDHFARAVGEKITVKLRDDEEGDRRLNGLLEDAGMTEMTLRTDDDVDHQISYGRIQRARVVYDWTKGFNKRDSSAIDETKETKAQ